MNKLLGVLLIVLSLLGGWLWMAYEEFLATPLQLPDGEVVYQVERGASLAKVARDLEAEGMLSDASFLQWYGRYTGQASQIRAGEYLLGDGLVPDALLALLVSGNAVTHALTLLEGWNIRQVRTAVATHEALQDTLGEADDEELMRRLGRPGEHPEGRFFPDTYHFQRNTTDIEFLRRALSKMDKELDAAWSQRAPDLPLDNPDQALILASIIEKETGQASERSQIAGVFSRRLHKGMKTPNGSDGDLWHGRGLRWQHPTQGPPRRHALQHLCSCWLATYTNLHAWTWRVARCCQPGAGKYTVLCLPRRW